MAEAARERRENRGPLGCFLVEVIIGAVTAVFLIRFAVLVFMPPYLPPFLGWGTVLFELFLIAAFVMGFSIKDRIVIWPVILILTAVLLPVFERAKRTAQRLQERNLPVLVQPAHRP